jgi:hypothetical protein
MTPAQFPVTNHGTDLQPHRLMCGRIHVRI